MNRSVCLILAACVLAGCGSVPARRSGGSTPGTGAGALSQRELNLADLLARREAKLAGATLSSATATVASGIVGETNTGHPCTSGRILHLKLIGDFPHALVAPSPGGSAGPVVEEDLTADASSGMACLISVRTDAILPAADAAVLAVPD